MQLFLTGVYLKNSKRKVFVVNDFEGYDTIRSLKLVISNKFNIPMKLFYMVSGGKALNWVNTLDELNIKHESTIHVNFRAGKPVIIS
tara:strand:- start:209 stop:469 length:261 start_codon:yes stop_codon:yes gene_type:complete